VGVLLVKLYPLRLEVRATGAAHFGAFVPLEAQPAQAFHYVFQRTGHIAGAVGVLDAEDKRASVVASEEPVEESRSGTAYVEVSSWARGEANSYGHFQPPDVANLPKTHHFSVLYLNS